MQFGMDVMPLKTVSMSHF